MEAWLLREWQRNSPWQILLRPLSWIFGALATARRGLYDAGLLQSRRVDVPVIVVGNVTAGGTGKTPVVLALVNILARSGWHCGIISRGYGRKRGERDNHGASAVQVIAGEHGSPVISDEATLLARRAGVPVYMSADRVVAARSLLENHPEVDVLISDDGLQHYGLHRDLEICVFDGARGVGNGELLPAGPLREPLARLSRVDAIVINGDTPAEIIRSEVARGVPLFAMSLGNETLVNVRDDRTLTIEGGKAYFGAQRILAVAGIGNPARFFGHLARQGFTIAESRAFPDHYPFTVGDFAARDAGIILMTEKDAVKCRSFADERMWFMRVDAILPDAFGEWIVNRLSELKK